MYLYPELLSEPKSYIIKLNDNGIYYFILAISHKIKETTNTYSILYRPLLTNKIPDKIEYIDEKNTLSFKSQLYFTDSVFSQYTGNRNNEKDQLEKTIKENFGDSFKITIKEID